ncbi:hypothetical protein HDV02_001668 [Globomyces sp. JEL0801]|nr:hypothetical protein HDV02_001668 [Globomyces sp. JEL0801]
MHEPYKIQIFVKLKQIKNYRIMKVNLIELVALFSIVNGQFPPGFADFLFGTNSPVREIQANFHTGLPFLDTFANTVGNSFLTMINNIPLDTYAAVKVLTGQSTGTVRGDIYTVVAPILDCYAWASIGNLGSIPEAMKFVAMSPAIGKLKSSVVPLLWITEAVSSGTLDPSVVSLDGYLTESFYNITNFYSSYNPPDIFPEAPQWLKDQVGKGVIKADTIDGNGRVTNQFFSWLQYYNAVKAAYPPYPIGAPCGLMMDPLPGDSWKDNPFWGGIGGINQPACGAGTTCRSPTGHDTFQSGIIQYENLYCAYDSAQEKPVLVANQNCNDDGSTGLCAQRLGCYENALAPGSKCYVCPAGISCINTIYGGHKINTCSIGTFARQGDGVCSKCPWGRTTIREGSTSESDCMCPAGSYIIQVNGVVKCVPCPSNSYCPLGSNKPTACPIGLGNSGLAASPNTCKCLAGFACPASGTYSICPMGTISTFGQNTCSICPAGTITYTTGSTECVQPKTITFKTIPQSTVIDKKLPGEDINEDRGSILVINGFNVGFAFYDANNVRFALKQDSMKTWYQSSVSSATGGAVQNILYETGRDIWNVYFVDRIGVKYHLDLWVKVFKRDGIVQGTVNPKAVNVVSVAGVLSVNYSYGSTPCVFTNIGGVNWVNYCPIEDGKFDFVEKQRSDTIIRLYDGSRGVTIDLDMYNRGVYYSETSGVSNRLLGLVTNAFPYPVKMNGRTIQSVQGQVGGIFGVFTNTGNGKWLQYSPYSSKTFNFVEVGRDEWSAYLNDPSRNMDLQIDMHRKTISWSAGESKNVYLGTITDAFPNPKPKQ